MDYKLILQDFYENQKYCDVKFVLKDSDGKKITIGAHKLILSMASDVFEVMFFGESVQRGLFSQEKEIKVEDIDEDAFKLFLRYETSLK